MKKYFFSLCFFSVLALNFAFAQNWKADEEIVILTVEKAIECAKANNRTLKSDKIDLAIKERAAKYSWNVFLPDVTASFSAARTTNIDSTLQSANGSMQMMQMIDKIHMGALSAMGAMPTPISEEEKMHWALVGNISASLNLSLAYIYKIKSAKKSYEGGEITAQQSEREVILNIKKLFYGLLLQQESLKIQVESLENARQRARQAEINYNNGRVPRVQMLNAQVTYQNKVPEIEAAAQNLDQQLDLFAFMLGLPVGRTKIKLSGSIEPEYITVNADELLRKYSENNLSIQSLQNNIDVLNMNIKALNLSSYTPALVLNYGWQPTGSWFTGDLEWADRGALTMTLAFNLTNMLPFSANRLQVKDLKDNIAKLEIAMETIKENQAVQVRKAVNTLNQARVQIDSMGRTVSLAQTSYDMSVTAYNNGRMELLDLRDSETQLNQAKLGQLNQKFNYLSALLDLEYELNTTLIK